MSDEPGWLHKQIEKSKREMETWPQWMKDAARFEGRKVMPNTDVATTHDDARDTTKTPQVVGPVLCAECDTYPADWPSKLCPGCEAYREHTEWF